jgi:hypothetical protein
MSITTITITAVSITAPSTTSTTTITIGAATRRRAGLVAPPRSTWACACPAG